MAKRNRSWFKNPFAQRKSASRKQAKSFARYLRMESLEPRQLLSGVPTTLAGYLIYITPDPHPSGDQPPNVSQLVPLAYYTANTPPPDPGNDPAITQFIQSEKQIFAGIENNSAARPGFWGENVAAPANQVRLHLDDNGMLIQNWTIDWGDGGDPQTVSPQPWVIHQYAAAGQYTVEVTATGLDGTYAGQASTNGFGDGVGIGGSSSGLQVTLAPAPPTLHVAAAQTVAQGQTFALDSLASFSYANASGPASFTYSIDWGDGSQPFSGSNVDMLAPGGGGSPFLGTLASDAGDGPLTHVYSNTGTYYLAVTVTADVSELSDTQTIPINVVTLTPTITGLPTNDTCGEGTTVTVGASVSTALTDPVAYNWQILDSSGDTVAQGTDPTLTYTFTGPDTYTVSLVTNVDSVSSSPVTAAITVNDLGPSFVSPTIPNINASVGQTFTLPPVAFTDPGLSNTHTATITWGDGSEDFAAVTEESSDGTTLTAGTITDSHAYTIAGTYTATIALTDQDGASATETFNVNVVSAVVTLNSFAPSSDGSQLQVSYSIANAAAAPFNINIYVSPDGTTPDQLLMSYPVTDSSLLTETSGTRHAVSFTPAFDDIASSYHLIAVCDSNSDPTENTVEFAGGIFVAASVTQSPPQNVLYVFGTDSGSGDTVYIHGASDSPANTVVFDGGTPFSIASTITAIHVRGEDGNDVFQADPDVTLPTWLYGGDGNNTLTGGAGSNVLVGGAGANIIHSSNGVNSPQTIDDMDTTAAFPGLLNNFQDVGTWTSEAVAGAFNGEELSHAASSGTDKATWTLAILIRPRIMMYMSPGRRWPGARRPPNTRCMTAARRSIRSAGPRSPLSTRRRHPLTFRRQAYFGTTWESTRLRQGR